LGDGGGAASDAGSYPDEGDLLNALKTRIQTAFKEILGNTTEGESNDHKFFVIIHNNCLIRVDIAIWRYNFSNDGVIAGINNAFCYMFCLSVVDHTKVSVDELMFLISETIGADPEDVQPYVESLLEVWELLGNVKITKARYREMAVEPAGMSVANSYMR